MGASLSGHGCRQLLRLPPFPLERLERACLDPPEGDGGAGPSGGHNPPDQAGPVAATAVGAVGQGRLIRDIHSAMLRLLEGHEEELQELATMAGYGPAAELEPHAAYR